MLPATHVEPRKKLLLVDDSQTVLLLHRMMLAHWGYEVRSARDGQEALAKAISERPDLILMDVVMPRMDGLQACRALRACRETMDVPILFVTGCSEPSCVQEAFASGCTDYLARPFDSEMLLARVRQLLGE